MSRARERLETIDAIRLALEGADSPETAVTIIRQLLEEAPPPNLQDTSSIRRLLRAVKQVRGGFRVVADDPGTTKHSEGA